MTPRENRRWAKFAQENVDEVGFRMSASVMALSCVAMKSQIIFSLLLRKARKHERV